MRDRPTLIEKLRKNRYLLLALLAGLLLLLLPGGCGGSWESADTADTAAPQKREEFSVEHEEERLRKALSKVAGAGEVTVLLSVSGGEERELAADGDGPAIVSSGGGAEEAVELSFTYPVYTGAVVVCTGADQAAVRMAVTGAVRSFTGLGSDKITVLKGN